MSPVILWTVDSKYSENRKIIAYVHMRTYVKSY